jgi:hypothetical protein
MHKWAFGLSMRMQLAGAQTRLAQTRLAQTFFPQKVQHQTIVGMTNRIGFAVLVVRLTGES